MVDTPTRPPQPWTVRGSGGARHDSIRGHNLSAVLSAVHYGRAVSRATLTRETGLNRSTIGAVVATLEEAGLVTSEEPDAAGTVGRPSPVIRPSSGIAALAINPLFVAGLVLAFVTHWALGRTRFGLRLRVVGDSENAARAFGLSPTAYRVVATAFGGACAGVGGASLSLVYPGAWSEALSSGQGVMAVALVIFARWSPVRCLGAALLFGGAGALGPALQSVGVSGYYYLFNAVPYILTLAILVWTCSPKRSLKGAPLELGVSR